MPRSRRSEATSAPRQCPLARRGQVGQGPRGLWKLPRAFRVPRLPSRPGLPPPPAVAAACPPRAPAGSRRPGPVTDGGRYSPALVAGGAAATRPRSAARPTLVGADLDPTDEAGAALGAEAVEELALEVGELGRPGGGVGQDLEGAVLLQATRLAVGGHRVPDHLGPAGDHPRRGQPPVPPAGPQHVGQLGPDQSWFPAPARHGLTLSSPAHTRPHPRTAPPARPICAGLGHGPALSCTDPGST